MKNGSKTAFGLDITHPGIRMIYLFLGATFIFTYFVDNPQSTVGLIKTIVFSTFFLMLAIFSPQLARRTGFESPLACLAAIGNGGGTAGVRLHDYRNYRSVWRSLAVSVELRSRET